ncbi:MAG: polysaccharide pyruvyl transferase family protein [Stellaceae bacterium]
MRVNVFDTAIASDNLGDEIIMEAVWEVLNRIFPSATYQRIASHRHATIPQMVAGRTADVSLVGGTNILKSHMLFRGNWRISPLDYLAWRNVVLLGVGWQHYGGGEADAPTRLFFRTVLSRSRLQSVRDMHTYALLRPHVPTAIYTGCPTMWRLTPEHCAQLPVRKAQNVIFAVTYYQPAPAADRALFQLLKRHYDKIFFWPQQAADVGYMRDLGVEGFIPLPRDVAQFDRILREEDVEFVGARLHGGIRALQRGRRALVVPVDNRATEISKVTHLPIGLRTELGAIERWIAEPEPTRIVLPWDSIERWQNQFSASGNSARSTAR